MRPNGRWSRMEENGCEKSGAENGQMNSCEAKQGLQCSSEGHVDKVEKKVRRASRLFVVP